MSSALSFAATAAGEREALFVTYANLMPPPRACATLAAACGTGSSPRYSTPSRSQSTAS
jgi:hypothetical protein